MVDDSESTKSGRRKFVIGGIAVSASVLAAYYGIPLYSQTEKTVSTSTTTTTTSTQNDSVEEEH